MKGIVYLVGAGPGDRGLLTLRGAELLGRADVVVYDALVNGDLLQLAPKSAEIIYAGKRAGQHSMPQDALNDLLVAKAAEGKCVVRLKGGDPYLYGRGGEEAEKLWAAKLPFEVVPGVSSALAAPAYAGIPVTHRDFASSLTIITGHEDPTKETSFNFGHLAKIPGTKVVLMGVERLQQLTQSLIDNGADKATPSAIVRWGTTGQQQTIVGNLGNLADKVVEAGLTAPAVLVIGDVVRLREKLNWFERRPLYGQRFVITRTREQASELSRQLLALGADILEIPTIKITAPDEKHDLKDALMGLGEYEWVVFTSPNGVTAFFDYLIRAFEDIRALGNVRICAVGPATAARLKELHLRVDLMPAEALTAKIAEAFTKFGSVENVKILLARAEKANPELPAALTELGAIVDDVAVYKTVPEIEDRNGAAARLGEEGADWITFTSSSTVENFHQRFGLPKLLQQYPYIKLASIGPETSKAIKALGLKPTVEARDHHIMGLVQAIQAYK